MIEKRKIHINTVGLDLKRLCGPIETVCEYLLSFKGADDNVFEELDADLNHSGYYLLINRYRLETDEEFQQRLEREKGKLEREHKALLKKQQDDSKRLKELEKLLGKV